MQRRNFIKAAGVTLALPALESFGAELKENDAKAKRILMFSQAQGICIDTFVPELEGRGYTPPEGMASLAPYQDQMTFFSSMRHRGGMPGGHPAQKSVFCGFKAGTPKHTDSLDQLIARETSNHTRVPFVTTGGGSFKNGLAVNGTPSAKRTFERLFAKVDEDVERRIISRQESLLDHALGELKDVERHASIGDKRKLDEYLSSIREAEDDLKKQREWLSKPRAEVEFKEREADSAEMRDFRAILDLTFLAFKFDVTRVSCYYMQQAHPTYHRTTHAVGGEKGQQSLTLTMNTISADFKTFFDKLSDEESPYGGTLFDDTISIITSAQNPSKRFGPHVSNELPMIVAGGGFKNHGSHVNYKGNVSPCNVYLSVIQQMGIEAERFDSSHGTANDVLNG